MSLVVVDNDRLRTLDRSQTAQFRIVGDPGADGPGLVRRPIARKDDNELPGRVNADDNLQRCGTDEDRGCMSWSAICDPNDEDGCTYDAQETVQCFPGSDEEDCLPLSS